MPAATAAPPTEPPPTEPPPAAPPAAGAVGEAVDSAAVLARLPEAACLVDRRRRVCWENGRLGAVLGVSGDPGDRGGDPGDFTALGRDLYDLPGLTGEEVDWPHPGGCPIAAVFSEHNGDGDGEDDGDGGGCRVAGNTRGADGRYFALTARRLPRGVCERGAAAGEPRAVVTVREVTREVAHRQKLDAIRRAGLALGDLTPEELPETTAADRIELLRGRVLEFTRTLMEFDTVEVRLLDDHTGSLRSLLSFGMGEGVPELPLRADPEKNGATGWVAATGTPYLCRDTAADPRYLPGMPGAKSALTVPLRLGEQVLGTFNVESAKPDAFDEDDVRFAELFAREVAAALHTLELLVAEKHGTARESTERTLREVSGPTDEIVRDAAWLLDKYIGHSPEMADRLKRILKNSRAVKTQIHRVGEALRPEPTRTPLPAGPDRPKLAGARVLVADADPHVRTAAHALLGRAGCEVETAHDAAEALLMARSIPYDAALVDVRLPAGGPPGGQDEESPDEPRAGGYECFAALRSQSPALPVIFMTGFGYDPGHSIVRARREGLHGVLYKPFRPDQLLGELEAAVR